MDFYRSSNGLAYYDIKIQSVGEYFFILDTKHNQCFLYQQLSNEDKHFVWTGKAFILYETSSYVAPDQCDQ